MLVVDCDCGRELVLDSHLAARIDCCPACLKPVRIKAAPDRKEPAVPEDTICTHICPCGKMLVAEEEVAAGMLRCPACGRLVTTYHAFGSEVWRPPLSAEAAPSHAVAPTVLESRSLEFHYERRGAFAMLCGAMMLATLAMPWNGELGWSILMRFFQGSAGSAGGGDSALLMFLGPAWIAGLAALLAGVFPLGRFRWTVVAAAGLAATAFCGGYLVSGWQRSDMPVILTQAQIAQDVALALAVPFLIVLSLRMRVSWRPGMSGALSFLSGVLILACLAGLAMSVRWFSLGQTLMADDAAMWNTVGFTGFFRKAGVMAGYLIDTPGVTMLLLISAGVMGLMHGATRGNLRSSLFICVASAFAALFAALAAGVAGGATGVAYLMMAGGMAGLVLSGFINALAGRMATPNDWERP